MPADHPPALILAGGGARRMGGGDKPLLDLAGQRIIERIIAALDTSHIAISANGDPARFAALQRPVIDDGEFIDQGPLAGVLAGLDWAASLGADTLLTIPGDTPFIPQRLPAALAPAPACAMSHDRPHYLLALWPTACRHDLRHLLSAPGRRDVAIFASRIGMRPVSFATPEGDPFLNVNTPEDLAAARTIAEGKT
jgi:molybdenum cofactor guanylyltransferase